MLTRSANFVAAIMYVKMIEGIKWHMNKMQKYKYTTASGVVSVCLYVFGFSLSVLAFAQTPKFNENFILEDQFLSMYIPSCAGSIIFCSLHLFPQ